MRKSSIVQITFSILNVNDFRVQHRFILRGLDHFSLCHLSSVHQFLLRVFTYFSNRFRSSPGCTMSTYSSRLKESSGSSEDDDEEDAEDDAEADDPGVAPGKGPTPPPPPNGGQLYLANLDFSRRVPSSTLFSSEIAFRPTSSLNGMMKTLKMKIGSVRAASTRRMYLAIRAMVSPECWLSETVIRVCASLRREQTRSFPYTGATDHLKRH